MINMAIFFVEKVIKKKPSRSSRSLPTYLLLESVMLNIFANLVTHYALSMQLLRPIQYPPYILFAPEQRVFS